MFTDGRFDALATCYLEGLRVREGGVVSTKSELEANDSQKDLVVSRSKLGKVFRSEGPCHIPVQQGLNHLGLQHSDFQAKGGEQFEAFPHKTDPSVDFEREVSVFADKPRRYKNWAVCLYVWPPKSELLCFL